MDSDLRDLERHGHEDQQVNHGCGSLLERSRNPDPFISPGTRNSSRSLARGAMHFSNCVRTNRLYGPPGRSGHLDDAAVLL
jgi:hypothetical protein